MFLKQPYLLRGNITFGNKNSSIASTIENPSQIVFELFANILSNAKTTYEQLSNDDSIVKCDSNCPREILKFNPPPKNVYCDQNIYRDLTTLHDFGLNITFSNVS